MAVNTAPRNRMAAFPGDLARASAAQVARWVDGLRDETAAAIRTRAARDRHYHLLERRHAGDPGAMATALRDDPVLPTLAWALADHQAAQTVYYQALAGEAAARTLLAGERAS